MKGMVTQRRFQGKAPADDSIDRQRREARLQHAREAHPQLRGPCQILNCEARVNLATDGVGGLSPRISMLTQPGIGPKRLRGGHQVDHIPALVMLKFAEYLARTMARMFTVSKHHLAGPKGGFVVAPLTPAKGFVALRNGGPGIGSLE